MENQKIYWDVDDVILNSMETATYIVNNLFNSPKGKEFKTCEEVKDWSMKSVHRELSKEQLEDIFASELFWELVDVKESFYGLMSKTLANNYKHVIITKGTTQNLELKKNYLAENLDFEYEYIGLTNEKKEDFVEEGSIQIDDNIENLIHSNASIKILLTNGRETVYNNAFGHYSTNHMDNLYIVSDLAQVKQILEFNLENNLIEI